MGKEYKYKDIQMKSDIEVYFAMYLQELKDHGFIKEWYYEKDTFELFKGYSRNFTIQLKTKTKESSEVLLEKASLTADFTVEWDERSRNIFFLDTSVPIKIPVSNIPFRLCSEDNNLLISYIETKGFNNSVTTSSNHSFPYKQKWVKQLHGVLVQKIQPFTYKKNGNALFQSTFYPEEVLKSEIYLTNTKWGKKGTSKIKHRVVKIKEFINDRSRD